MRRSRRILKASLGAVLAIALLGVVPSVALAEVPTVSSESVSAVSDTSATFEASINPLGIETSYEFQYATDEAFTENAGSVQGTATLPEAFEELPTGPIKASGLKPQTVYFYRAVATNAFFETTEGPIQSFETLEKTAVTVEEAEGVTRTGASISGTVNPGGANATYRVVYASEADYRPGAGECPEGIPCAYFDGASSSTRSTFATGYALESVGPITLEELKPGTTYHYTLIATNAAGTTVGPDQTFKTLAALPPIVTIDAATNLAPTTATITGTVDTRGLSTSTQFLLSTESSSVSDIPATITGQSGNTLELSASLGGLQPSTTYTYQLIATNSDGTEPSTEVKFTTPAAPPTLTPSATLPALAFTPLATITSKEAKENKENIQRELLNKALRTCKHKHNKHKRKTCEQQARKKYKL